MVRRAPAVAPVGRKFLAQNEPIAVYVELARNIPERRARTVVPLSHALPPVRALAVLGFARLLKRADTLGHGAEVRRLCERRRVLGLERVEVGLERRVVREQVMRVQPAPLTNGYSVRLRLRVCTLDGYVEYGACVG